MTRTGGSANAGAMAVAVAAGAAGALQAYVNGRLSTELGSVYLAATANLTVGIAIVTGITFVTDAGRRALQRWRHTGGLRAWYLLGGVAGAAYVLVMATGAPRVGVALLTVGIVAGQVAGGLVIDRVGLAPGGPRAITRIRLIAPVVAICAVVLSGGPTSRTPANLHFELLTAALVVGFGLALQSAANGHIARVTGEPIMGSLVNFAVGFVCVFAVALPVAGLEPPHGWSAPAWAWTGGLLGAAAVTIISAVVARLGVLRLMLGFVAGQAACALAIDVVAPAPDGQVTIATILGVAMAFLAVRLMAGETSGRD